MAPDPFIINKKNMNIQETIFKSQTYLTLRKVIPMHQISDKQMYDEAGKKLGMYMEMNNIKPTGPWTVLYFSWDETSQKTEIGIAFPIKAIDTINNPEFSLVSIPETKASVSVLIGSYDNLGTVHHKLMQYSHEHMFAQKGEVMAVEEYEQGPMTHTEMKNWKTNVYYLHD